MRKLTQIEKDKLKEFRKAENVMWMFLNLAKIIIPLNLMIACLMAGFTIDDKILWFLVISTFIANFIAVSMCQTKVCPTVGKDLDCVECMLISKNEQGLFKGDPQSTKMVVVEIDGIMRNTVYRGNKFKELVEGDNIIAIEIENNRFESYSYAELNY